MTLIRVVKRQRVNAQNAEHIKERILLSYRSTAAVKSIVTSGDEKCHLLRGPAY